MSYFFSHNQNGKSNLYELIFVDMLVLYIITGLIIGWLFFKVKPLTNKKAMVGNVCNKSLFFILFNHIYFNRGRVKSQHKSLSLLGNIVTMISCTIWRWTAWCLMAWYYRQTSSISHTKSKNSNVSHLILQLSLPNPLKPGVESRMKM